MCEFYFAAIRLWMICVLRWQIVPEYGSKCAINVEESSSSFKCWSPNRATETCKRSRSLSNDIVVEPDFPSSSKCDTSISGKQNGVAHPMKLHSLNDVSSTFMAWTRPCLKFILLQMDIFLTLGGLYIPYLQQYIACRIENDIIYVEAALCAADQFDIDSLKSLVACLYYLQFPTEKRSEGR